MKTVLQASPVKDVTQRFNSEGYKLKLRIQESFLSSVNQSPSITDTSLQVVHSRGHDTQDCMRIKG